MSSDIFILGGARTAIGTLGGTLKDLSPTKLGSVAVREAISRAGLLPADVDHSVFGTVIPTDYCAFYAATLAGFDTASLQPLREQFLREWVEPRIPDDARELLSKCRAVGDLLVLTTATNRAISELTAASLGVDHFICTELEMSNGRYTGRTAGILNMRSGKIDRLRAWLDELGQPQRLLREASFYSDSINDVALLSAVQHPIVVDPDPRLEATARQKGWTVLRLSRTN